MGHIRDLAKKEYGIDIEQRLLRRNTSFRQIRRKSLSELKKQVKDSKVVWLASDEDREGEAIAWHLCEELNLDPKKHKAHCISRDYREGH
jgi:DNA topoisomerase-1